MEAASMSKMLSEEILGSLLVEAQLPDGATAFQWALDQLSPLPISQRLGKEGLSYQSPIGQILTAKHHIDPAWTAQTLAQRMASLRQENFTMNQANVTSSTATLSPSRADQVSLHHSLHPLDRSGIIRLPLPSCPAQFPGLLSWVLDENTLLDWLILANGVSKKAKWPQSTTKQGIQKKNISPQRLFTWQHSQTQCRRLLQLLRREQNDPGNCRKEVTAGVLASSHPGISNLLIEALPVIAAQMAVIDAMTLVPQKSIAAVDSLTMVLESWLRPLVLNNLLLRQMAEREVTELLIQLTQRLVSQALVHHFDQFPVSSL